MKISIYDFDETLYNGDSLWDFYKYCLKKYPLKIFYFPYQFIAFTLWKLKLLSTTNFKQAFLIFLTQVNATRDVENFWNIYKDKIFPWANQEILNDQNDNLTVLVISASPDFLLLPAMKYLNIKKDFLICTKTKYNQHRKITGKNCKGKEKVERLKRWADEKDIKFKVKKMTSDSIVDLPLYKIADKQYKVVNEKIDKGIAK